MKGHIGIFEEKYINCRLCNTLVGSSNPICRKCGLEMSSEGIRELSAIDEEEGHGSFADIYNLRILAIISLVMSIIGYLACLGIGNVFFYKLYFWCGLTFYISAYISWNNKFSKKTLSFEEKEIVRKEKIISLTIFSLSTFINSFIYIFLLKYIDE